MQEHDVKDKVGGEEEGFEEVCRVRDWSSCCVGPHVQVQGINLFKQEPQLINQ